MAKYTFDPKAEAAKVVAAKRKTIGPLLGEITDLVTDLANDGREELLTEALAAIKAIATGNGVTITGSEGDTSTSKKDGLIPIFRKAPDGTLVPEGTGITLEDAAAQPGKFVTATVAGKPVFIEIPRALPSDKKFPVQGGTTSDDVTESEAYRMGLEPVIVSGKIVAFKPPTTTKKGLFRSS